MRLLNRDNNGQTNTEPVPVKPPTVLDSARAKDRLTRMVENIARITGLDSRSALSIARQILPDTSEVSQGRAFVGAKPVPARLRDQLTKLAKMNLRVSDAEAARQVAEALPTLAVHERVALMNRAPKTVDREGWRRAMTFSKEILPNLKAKIVYQLHQGREKNIHGHMLVRHPGDYLSEFENMVSGRVRAGEDFDQVIDNLREREPVFFATYITTRAAHRGY